MPVKEFIEYLKRWPDTAEVGFLCADIENRKIFQTLELTALVDSPMPLICLDIGNPEDFDEEEARIAKECEQDDDDKTAE